METYESNLTEIWEIVIESNFNHLNHKIQHSEESVALHQHLQKWAGKKISAHFIGFLACNSSLEQTIALWYLIRKLVFSL